MEHITDLNITVSIYLTMLALTYYSGTFFFAKKSSKRLASYIMLSVSSAYFVTFHPNKETWFIFIILFIFPLFRRFEYSHSNLGIIKLISEKIADNTLSCPPLKKMAKQAVRNAGFNDNEMKKPCQYREASHTNKKQIGLINPDRRTKHKRRKDDFRQKEQDVNYFKSRYLSPKNNNPLNYTLALNIFGLSEPFDQYDLKRAYKKLLNQYHPDKNTGSTQAVKKMVLEIIIEIMNAKKFIEIKNGWKLERKIILSKKKLLGSG